ncbi:MAG: class B sortase [Clostridia bacterium]|nr:class B sortase [Clostridia bacterium]
MAKNKEVKDDSKFTKKDVGKATLGFFRRLILGIAFVGIIVASFVLVDQYIKPRINQNEYKKEPEYSADETNTETMVATDTGEEIRKKYAALLNTNPDFVGKLYIEAIEEAGFIVVQGTDNQKYLTTGFKGEATRYGTLFVDYRNDVNKLNTNTIIYGHNMRDGSQLGSLSLYSKIENYKSFPTIKFNTIYGENEWKVFAAFIINTKAEDDNGYVFPYLTTTFPSEEKFMAFIDDVKSRSYYTNDSVDIKPDDKILTLSTCDTVFSNARFVLMARLVRDGESAEVDVESAKENENQRFPQAWYNKKGKKNPFKNADNFTLD